MSSLVNSVVRITTPHWQLRLDKAGMLKDHRLSHTTFSVWRLAALTKREGVQGFDTLRLQRALERPHKIGRAADHDGVDERPVSTSDVGEGLRLRLNPLPARQAVKSEELAHLFFFTACG